MGDICFWDGLGMGLAGGENFSLCELGLEPGESVTTLTRADVSRRRSYKLGPRRTDAGAAPNIHSLNVCGAAFPLDAHCHRR